MNTKKQKSNRILRILLCLRVVELVNELCIRVSTPIGTGGNHLRLTLQILGLAQRGKVETL